MSQPISAPYSSMPLRDAKPAPSVASLETLEDAATGSPAGDVSFDEVLEAVNPLQHIPVVSAIYRAVSGHEIGLGPRIIGAAILGGPIGVIIAGITAMFEEATGGTIAEHAKALFDDLYDGGEAPIDKLAGNFGDAEDGAGVAARKQTAAVDASALATTPGEAYPPLDDPALDGQYLAAAPPPAATPFAVAAKPIWPPAPGLSGQPEEAESARIARRLLESQRAQASLLLANLKSHEVASARRTDEDDRRAHVNLPPSGARPGWYADAMQRALDKYQSIHVTRIDGS